MHKKNNRRMAARRSAAIGNEGIRYIEERIFEIKPAMNERARLCLSDAVRYTNRVMRQIFVNAIESQVKGESAAGIHRPAERPVADATPSPPLRVDQLRRPIAKVRVDNDGICRNSLARVQQHAIDASGVNRDLPDRFAHSERDSEITGASHHSARECAESSL